MTKAFVSRPALAFRIGVTGARALEPAAIDALRLRLRAVLEAVHAKMLALSQDTRVQAAYNQASPAPQLRMVSPLAEGADRLVAEEALALGYQLDAPLPFAREIYTQDFPSSVATFEALLHRAGARVLELDGDRDNQAQRSYEAVGRLVVRNCDLLIAVWDGSPGGGRGGTADIVRHASRFGPPVLWLQADGSDGPVWIEEPRALRHPDLFALRGKAAWEALTKHIEELVLPPPSPPHHPHGVIQRLTNRLWPRSTTTPLADYLAETPRSARWIWQVHGRLIAWTSRSKPASAGRFDPPTPSGPIGAYWQPFYEVPNNLAVSYAVRYRSSYVLVFGMAAAAVIGAVLGLVLHHPLLTLIELLVLLGILAIVVASARRRWHERLIACRLLAELCRKQQALALLGWSLPPADTIRASAGSGVEPGRDAWVGWYFNATRRAAPLAAGRFGHASTQAMRDALRDTLVKGQVAYHRERAKSHGAAAAFFGERGEMLFLGIVGLVALELVLTVALHWHGVAAALGVAAAVLPAVSAAFVGIRGYAELEMLSEQSVRMCHVMERAEARLKAQPLRVPLASQELGEEVFDLASDMLRDVAGWTQLFQVKAVEVG